jgi:hypothetical protein
VTAIVTGSDPDYSGRDRELCGWRVQSTLALPELNEWHGVDRPSDVRIEVGPVPSRLEHGRCVLKDATGGSLLEVAPAGAALLYVQDVARFLITRGDRVVVEPLSHDLSTIRAFLLGSVLAVLCYQRRVVPLHASCLEIDGTAIAFAGESGAGKSTLAMMLALQGHRVVADDVCPVDLTGANGPLVWPSANRLKLWSESLQLFGMAADPSRRVRQGAEKYAQSAPHFVTRSIPLSAMYHLVRESEGATTDVRVVAGIDAVHAIDGMLYRAAIGRSVAGGEWVDRALMTLLAQVPVFALSRDEKSDTPSSLAARVLDHIGATKRE